MPELDDLRAFVEVVNHRSLTQAARRLGVAKSIVSRRIGRLEAMLGTGLLARSPRGVTPTEPGLDLHARAESILAELAEAYEAAASRRGELVGRLRLSLPLSFGLRHVAPLLAAWCAANPRLEIDAAYSDRPVDLLAEPFDAAIRIGVLRDSSLVARRIAPIRLAVVASPAYVEAHGAPAVPDDLAGHECLIYSGARQRMAWTFRSAGVEQSVLPHGRFWADSGEALVLAAEAGLGVTVLPTFLASDGLRGGRLVRLLADYTLPEEGLYVLRPPGAHVPGKVRGLIDLLLKAFGEEPAWDAVAPPGQPKVNT